MTHVGTFGDEHRLAEAADWFVRLQTVVFGEHDAVAFDAWLADPANTRAYDAVAAVANEYGANARAVSAGLSRRRAARPDRRALFAGFGAVAAATASFPSRAPGARSRSDRPRARAAWPIACTPVSGWTTWRARPPCRWPPPSPPKCWAGAPVGSSIAISR